jgi:hypothetical protein
MLTVMTTGMVGVGEGAGVMFELDSRSATAGILEAGGWTLLTAVNLMLFSLVHNPTPARRRSTPSGRKPAAPNGRSSPRSCPW